MDMETNTKKTEEKKSSEQRGMIMRGISNHEEGKTNERMLG